MTRHSHCNKVIPFDKLDDCLPSTTADHDAVKGIDGRARQYGKIGGSGYRIPGADSGLQLFGPVGATVNGYIQKSVRGRGNHVVAVGRQVD